MSKKQCDNVGVQHRRWGLSWSLLVALGALPLTFAAAAPDFSKDVEPLLRRYCLQCHGEAARMGGLDLRSPSKILKGGAKGPAVLKGSAAGSLLYQRIADQSMPMGPTKVSPKDREVIAAWINAGAPGDEPAAATATTGQKHWAFLPLAAAPAQPQVNAAVWVRSPVDAFTLRAMEQRGIRPARPADDRTLVRRLYLTLTGLPPSPEQAAAPFTDALIDDLLSRPQYGERWARHWLDVVRYAESNGYERDGTKPSAWRYRDWVIDAFNNNKRFDRFIAEQLAGDELEDSNAESQIATTFLRLGVWDDEPADQRMDRYDQLDDVLATTSAAFLGLTLRCARCHDHKFEPFSQKDYTRVLSIFEPLQRPLKGQTELDRQVGTAAELRAYEDAVRAADAEADPLRKLIANLKRGLLERLQSRGEEAQAWQESLPTVLALRVAPERRSAQQAKLAGAFEKKLEVRMLDLATGEERAQLDDWNRRLGEIEGSRPKPPVRAYVWYEEPGKLIPPTRLFHRGDPTQARDTVEPGVPSILGGDVFETQKTAAGSSGRRLWLARWLSGAGSHLTARVFVNRVWQWHFGEGLAATANDFGVMGQRPSNPELLDYLAGEFIRSGWSVKHLQKLILRSNTFRVSPEWNERNAALDPEQTLLWRWKPRRLEAEVIRDSVLSVTGSLNPAVHGPSIYPDLPKPVLAQQSRPGDGWGKSYGSEAARRSIYIFAKRGLPVPEIDLLDAPDTTVSCERRRVSVTGPQALTLFNGAFAQQQAARLAARIRTEGGGAPQGQVARAFQLVLGREASPRELDDSLSFLNASGGKLEPFCLVLLNTNEFFYIN